MTITVSSHRASQSREHRAYWLVAVALGCLVLAGCASQSATAPSPAPPPPTQTASAPPTSATYSAELCSAAAEYQTAANAIVHLDASQAGTDGVKAALQELEAAANKLIASAQEQFGPQIAELERAIASLKGTIAGLTDQDSVSTNLGKITASVSAVEQAAKPIVDSVRTGCASVPPAETPAAS
jgi:PBP1b-binding outer membrane lipoprotein LpoB